MRDLLFSTRRLSDLFEEKLGGMLQEINAASDDAIETVVTDEWADALAARYAIEAPALDLAAMWMEEATNLQYDVSGQGFQRALPEGSGPFFVPGTQHVVHVPFSGDLELFFLRPNSYTLDPPTGTIQGSNFLVTIEYPNDSAPGDLAAIVQQNANRVEEWLRFARADVEQHNQSLKHHALGRIDHRKQEVAARRERVISSGIPVGPPHARSPTLVKAVVRRPSPLPAAPTRVPIPLEPSLAHDVFLDVLAAIAQAARDFERAPGAYAGMDEEALRQVLLLALNSRYDGMTTAEAFNFAGKTDLRIVHEGKGLFIGECKFWSGPKGFTETIDQLISYAAWHDRKLAVIMFVRTKSLSDVVAKAGQAQQDYPGCRDVKTGADETEFLASIERPGDPGRLLDVATRLIHLPPAA